MLHDPYPVVDLLGQISGSNCWSNSLVKLPVEFTDQIHWSNCWIKSVGQIPGSNSSIKFAGQTQAILGPTLASLGARMGAPTD
jgi:hypothetical protein